MTDKSSAPRTRLARKIAIDLAVMTIIGVLLALVGPFGSFQDPLPVRLLVWLAFSYLGYAIYSPMAPLVERAHRSLELPRSGLWVAAVLIATIPMSAAVWILRNLPDLSDVPVPTAEAGLLNYFYVLIIGGGTTLLFNAIDLNKDYSEQPASDDMGGAVEAKPAPIAHQMPEAPASNPLLNNLPAELGTDIIALEMEDHYVRVHTALGSQLVLMRLRDAMAHLSDVDGRQVHRSWWVARGAVEDVVREGRNMRLKLPREIEAPVSRAQVSELKEAGWI